MKGLAVKAKSSLAGMIALILAGCATMPAADAPLPTELHDARAVYAEDCKPDAPVFARDLILRADLNGDGRDDYVVNAAAYQCRGDTPYCGSAGCETQIFMSAPGGVLEQRFSGHVQEPPRIVRRNGKPALVSGAGRSAEMFDSRSLRFAPAPS